MELVFFKTILLPTSVKGIVSIDVNGNYLIFLNSKLSPEERQHTAEHELLHLALDHFYDGNPTRENEKQVERILKKQKRFHLFKKPRPIIGTVKDGLCVHVHPNFFNQIH